MTPLKFLAGLSDVFRRRVIRSGAQPLSVGANTDSDAKGERTVDAASCYFDEVFYRKQVASEDLGALTPWLHYRQFGEAIGLRPTALFDPRHYAASRPDVVDAGVNLLEHFTGSGIDEGFVPVDVESPEVLATALEKLAADPTDRLARLVAATDAFRRGRYEEAIEVVRRVPARGVAEQLIETKGLYLLGRYLEAIESLSCMDDAVPRHAPTFKKTMLGEIGHAASAAGDYATAITAYETMQSESATPVGDLPGILKALCTAYIQELCNAGKWDEGLELKRLYEERGLLDPTLAVDIVSVERNAKLSRNLYREFLAERVITPPMLMFRGEAGALSAEQGELIAPPQYYSEIRDCLAFSDANAVLQQGRVIYDLAAHPRGASAILQDRAAGGRYLFQARAAGRALVEVPELPNQTHEAGLMMFGVVSSNYGHWFLEYLPRMLAFNRANIEVDVPLFVNHGMPASHLESLELLNVHKRRIVTIGKGETLKFARLGVAPIPAYFPLDTHGGTYDTVWPADIFGELRDVFKRSIGIESRPGAACLFISRRSFTQRRLLNEEVIERHLVRLGFEVIYPEQLSFADQVRKFSSARIVVGSCSSALTNCIFCPKGAVVLGLIHDNASFNFYGYASFLMAGGVEIRFIRGKRSGSSQTTEHPLHANYEINMEHLCSALLEAGIA
ncbi:glycosyltransferase family 61 protein [Variovorax guangxiensis]|uniref:Glycosyltransferase family 61 protein n=1 Tax=Variovorax guangxiensis TaxID=1775474 RepID=A0A502DUV7_9BURK|nr:glycosyltransferase family 61 protein [Variovorax guangxiensis]TPG24544.1 glycosyltransferase family 61 protein [Variovorax ginsengisoli]TPG28794.1 glycosyltransferase family 61 protein [Variovorax guangxiensis]